MQCKGDDVTGYMHQCKFGSSVQRHNAVRNILKNRWNMDDMKQKENKNIY